MARRPAAETRETLPVVVKHPRGRPTEVSAKALEDTTLNTIRSGPGDRLREHASAVLEGAVIARTTKDIDQLVARVDAFDLPEDDRVRLQDAIRHAGRQAAGHIVIHGVGGSAEAIVLKRSIEYLGSPNGFPVAIRYVVEVLASNLTEGALEDGILFPSASLISADLIATCVNAAMAASGIVGILSQSAPEELVDSFVLPVELHLRGPSEGGRIFEDLVNALMTFMQQRTNETFREMPFERLNISGPYLPGTAFLEQTQLEATAKSMQAREIARRATLVSQSCLGLGIREAIRCPTNEHMLVLRAGDGGVDEVELMSDPRGPRVRDLIDIDTSDPRRSVLRALSRYDAEIQTMFEIRRILAVETSGELPVVELTHTYVAAVGHPGNEEVNEAIADAVGTQLLDDIGQIANDLSGEAYGMKMIVAAPEPVLAVLRAGWFEDRVDQLETICGRRPEFEFREHAPITSKAANADPDGEKAAIWPKLPGKIYLDAEMIFEGIVSQFEGIHDTDDAIDSVDLLVPGRGGPKWIDLDEAGEETDEPFLLSRIWCGGSPYPAIVSTRSGHLFDTEELEVADIIVGLSAKRPRAATLKKASVPADMVADLGARLFNRTSIAVARIADVLPLPPEAGPYLSSTIEPGKGLERHLAECAIAGDEDPGERLREFSSASRLHIAVDDSLSSGLGTNGAAHVIAAHLALEACELIGMPGRFPTPEAMFVCALAWIHRKEPSALDEAACREAAAKAIRQGLLHTVLAQIAADNGYDLDVEDELDRWVKEVFEIAPQGVDAQVPIYVAVAQVAALYELVDDIGEFDFLLDT